MKKINVAVLNVDNGHVPYIVNAIKADPSFNICAVSYSIYETETKWSHLFEGIPYYHDDLELLNNHKEVEMAILGGTNKHHIEQFRLCAERGIHVISMKIPSLDLAEFDEMVALQEKYHIECAIELEMRWRAEILRAKELVENGAIGNVLSFNAYNYSHFPMWWNPWMNNPEQSYGKRIELVKGVKDGRYRGGCLSDHPHIFDLARFILSSNYKTVYAQAAPNFREDSEVEDMVSVIGTMENGVCFSFNPSYGNKEKKLFKRTNADFSYYPRCVEVGFSIHGDKGSILVDAYGTRCNQTMIKEYDYDFKSWGNSGFILDDARRIFLKNFVKRIRGEKTEDFTMSLKEYKHIIEAINAAYESIYTGKIITIERNLNND